MGLKFDFILGKLRVSDQYDDTQIQADLAQEILDRGAADTTLQNNINAEATARSNADNALDGRITTLENNEIRVIYSEQISSDSGTITKPTNSTILADQFPGGIDAYVTTIDTGEPTGDNPRTAVGDLVDVATFDTSGNYTLTGVPDSYPVMLIYVLKIKEIHAANLTLDNIIQQYKLNNIFYEIRNYKSLSGNLASATTYYLGMLVAAWNVTANARRFQFEEVGTVEKVVINITHSSAPTNEPATIYLRNNTTGTDYVLGNIDFTLCPTNQGYMFKFTGLSIPVVNSTNQWTLKLVLATMVTPPSAFISDIRIYNRIS